MNGSEYRQKTVIFGLVGYQALMSVVGGHQMRGSEGSRYYELLNPRSCLGKIKEEKLSDATRVENSSLCFKYCGGILELNAVCDV